MEAAPLQATYQWAIQSVIISGNENRGIVVSLEGLHLNFTHNAACASRFSFDASFLGGPRMKCECRRAMDPVIFKDLNTLIDVTLGRQ